MPSKKYTAQQRAERERRKLKEQRKSGFPILPFLIIIIIIGIVGVYFLFLSNGTDTDTIEQNSAPILKEDYKVLAKNSNKTMVDALANDYDLDNDQLNITSITDPSHGAVELLLGVIYYTPETNFSGVDSIEYTVTDGENEVASEVHLIVAEDNPIALIDTTMGTIALELYQDKAPITVKNFIDHANVGYYDGLMFHRVVPDFMIQGGDPNGDGTGGHAAEYHEGLGDPTNPETWAIPDEFHEDLSNVAGTISMANAGSNTGGSQFFINVADNTYLDYDKEPLTSKHAVFGKVLDGQDVVDAISEVDRDSDNRPLTEVVMNSVTIENQ